MANIAVAMKEEVCTLKNDLLVNSCTMEAIITETRQQIAKFDQSLSVVVADSNVPFVDKLHLLGE